MLAANSIAVSAITFFEIAQKARIGKWPEMADYVDRLPEFLKVSALRLCRLTLRTV